MAKKKEEKAEEAVIVNEVKPAAEGLVTIEMTEEQQEEFVAFMAAKEQKSKEQAESEEPVAIHLTYQHNINGKKIGPGVTQVPRYMLGMLQDQEFKQRDLELSRFQDKGRIFQVLQSGQAVPVHATNAKKAGF